MQSVVDEAIALLTDCGHQEELIDMIKNEPSQENKDKISA